MVYRDDSRGVVRGSRVGRRRLDSEIGQVATACELQKFVVAEADLPGIFLGARLVACEERSQHIPMRFDFCIRGFDCHPVFAGAHAGRGERPFADVHDTHSANAYRAIAWVVAEGRDLDPVQSSRFPEGGAFGNLDLSPVDRDLDHARASIPRARSLAISLWVASSRNPSGLQPRARL